MNKQRESVYTLRREILEGKVHLTEDEVVDTRGYLLTLAEDLLDDHGRALRRRGDRRRGVGSRRRSSREVSRDLRLRAATSSRRSTSSGKSADEIADAVWALVKAQLRREGSAASAPTILRRVERDIMLQIVDAQWKDHLYSLDHLKEGIGLRGYGQRDPLVEYKKESFALFQDMKDRIEEEIVRYLWRLRPVIERRRRRRRRRAAASGAAPPRRRRR